MHIIISIELFEAFTTLIFTVFQHKSKTQRKNTRYKKGNIFLNEQLTSADDNYLKKFFYYKLIFSSNHFTFSQFLNINIKSILIMSSREKSKNKVNKKSFNRRLKSRNRYSSATNLKSFDFLVLFLFNDTNQSTAENKNEKSEQIKMSDTIKSYFKTISFF